MAKPIYSIKETDSLELLAKIYNLNISFDLTNNILYVRNGIDYFKIIDKGYARYMWHQNSNMISWHKQGRYRYNDYNYMFKYMSQHVSKSLRRMHYINKLFEKVE